MTSTLIEIDVARRIVLEHTHALEGEPVALARAHGRVLAADVDSDAPVPPFDNSAMDGFALRHRDVAGADPRTPVALRITGESRAGHPARQTVGPDQAVAISTGAMLPAGADAVVAVEQTHTRDGHVEILTEVALGDYVRLAGEDIRAGQRVLARGTRLGAAELGVLASLGQVEVSCARRPRVAVITTGDELVAAGSELTPGAIHDANAYSVPALVRQLGAEPSSVVTVSDDAQATQHALADALADADVVVICGGVSVGVHDHVRPSLATLGVDEHFWGVALRPGKPTWFGTRAETLVFGLPGNPVSAMVTFTLFVASALDALSGVPASVRRSYARLTCGYTKAPGRAHAVRCRLLPDERGWQAQPTGDQRSHILTSMLDADALAIIPTASGDVRAGERVEVELLAQMWPGLQ
jgi:molybdopterin molybdotransferase